MFNFKKGALSLLLKLLVKALVLVYYAVFFLFFLVSIGFHVQVQSRHKRFVYRKRYSSTIHRTFSHFSFLHLLLLYFSSRFFILVFECSLGVEHISLQSKLVLECPMWLASQKNDIFAPTSKNTPVIQTNPSPVPMELNLGL